MPSEARRAVLRNALRLATRTVVLVDISPHYTPSSYMLSGEPYVLDYLSHIEEEIQDETRRTHATLTTSLVAKTATKWVVDLSQAAAATALGGGF